MSEAPQEPASRGDEKHHRYTVPEALDGARVDKALVVLAKLSRSQAKALFDRGVRVNDRRAPKGMPVKAGDVITIEPDEAAGDPSALADKGVAIDVRFESDEVLVVHKPARIATAPVRPGERGTLANGLIAAYPALAGVGVDPREPGLVHRLDVETSGLVIVARSNAAREELKEAMRRGGVEKRYLAIVAPGASSARASSVRADGDLPDRGTIDYPLADHPKDDRRVFACVHERDIARLHPRDAHTSFVVLKRWKVDGAPRALVEATAARALRHQIRVHFAALGAPLVGDGLYGGPAAPEVGRHALHASRVAYAGGRLVKPFVVEAKLPDDLQALVP
jgi:23S rRNA pseudouridine1911/1915/1917 synthase